MVNLLTLEFQSVKLFDSDRMLMWPLRQTNKQMSCFGVSKILNYFLEKRFYGSVTLQ